MNIYYLLRLARLMKYLTKLPISCILFCLEVWVEADAFGFVSLRFSISFWKYFFRTLQKNKEIRISELEIYDSSKTGRSFKPEHQCLTFS